VIRSVSGVNPFCIVPEQHLRLLTLYCLRERYKHYLNEGGWGHKTGIKLRIYHPIYLPGEIFGLLNYLTKVKNYGKDRLNQSKTGVR